MIKPRLTGPVKQGFENGNDKDFKELIEKMNIKIN